MAKMLWSNGVVLTSSFRRLTASASSMSPWADVDCDFLRGCCAGRLLPLALGRARGPLGYEEGVVVVEYPDVVGERFANAARGGWRMADGGRGNI